MSSTLTIYEQMCVVVLRYTEGGSSREQQSGPMDVDGLAAFRRVRWQTGSRSALRQTRVGCEVPKLAATATIAGTWDTVNQTRQIHLTKTGILEMAKATVNDPEAPTDIKQSTPAHKQVQFASTIHDPSGDSMAGEAVGNLFAPSISDNEVRSKSAAGAAPTLTPQQRASRAGGSHGSLPQRQQAQVDLSYLQRAWRLRPQPRLRLRFQHRHGEGRCEPYNADRDYYEGEANHFSRDQCRSFDAERWTEFAEVQATAKDSSQDRDTTSRRASRKH